MEIRDKDIDAWYIYDLKSKFGSSYNIGSITFVNCNFTDSFIFADFENCEFINCSFYRDSFHKVSFKNCLFKNITFVDDPRCCMYDCYLDNCNLDDVFQQSFEETAPCRSDEDFIAWKAALTIHSGKLEYCIVKLLIPKDAKRSCAFSNKCRSDMAKVLDIQKTSGESLGISTNAFSLYKRDFCYVIGKVVTPREPFDLDQFNECSSGIHFFMSREEAVEYLAYAL